MLDLPPLETIDTPFEADIPDLEVSLAAILAQTIHEVQTCAAPDWNYACAKTFPYTWEKIFSKIDQVYQLAGMCFMKRLGCHRLIHISSPWLLGRGLVSGARACKPV